MKYFFIFLLVLSLIAPCADEDSTVGSIFRDTIYNYITSLERTVDYLVDSSEFLTKLSEIPYERTYEEVMEDRSFTKHLVSYGETLDDIIKTYNSNIEDMESFREIVYKENPNLVSSSYELTSGDYITVPSE